LGTAFVRRHLPQVAALAAAVFIVAGVGVAALRVAGTPRSANVTRPPVTARTVATPDPRVDEVKAVARRFIEALWESARTGDATAVRALTEAGTPAEGNSLVAATISRSSRRNFIASRVDVDETSWRISLLLDHATVNVAYRLYGHDAEWPTLRPLDADRETPAYPGVFQMDLVGQRWLVAKFN
jgi:hypothetical protein